MQRTQGISLSALPPSCTTLQKEGFNIVQNHGQLSPALRIGILNLMPDKAATERHWLRLLAQTREPLQIELLKLNRWQPKNTPAAYLKQFYQSWDQVAHLDAIIITGAPLGKFDFDKVGYWQELTQIFSRVSEQQKPCLYLCWAANAAFHHFYQLPRILKANKLSGIFSHHAPVSHSLTKGLDYNLHIPHSRYAEVNQQELKDHNQLKVLIDSSEAGAYLVSDDQHKRVFLLGHPEYEAGTLAQEFQRDQKKGIAAAMPFNYFPNNDTNQLPQADWQQSGVTLLNNWISSL